MKWVGRHLAGTTFAEQALITHQRPHLPSTGHTWADFCVRQRTGHIAAPAPSTHLVARRLAPEPNLDTPLPPQLRRHLPRQGRFRCASLVTWLAAGEDLLGTAGTQQTPLHPAPLSGNATLADPIDSPRLPPSLLMAAWADRHCVHHRERLGHPAPCRHRCNGDRWSAPQTRHQAAWPGRAPPTRPALRQALEPRDS